MATEATVITEAKAYFVTMADRLATVWPNDAESVDTNGNPVNIMPRYEFIVGPTIPTNIMLGAGDPSNTTYLIQINTVVEQNTYVTDAETYIDRVIQHFAFGTTYGRFTVIAAPERAGSSINDSGEYRTPVTIRIKAITG